MSQINDTGRDEKARTSVTIPAFNKEESLPRPRERLVESLTKEPDPWEVISVNEGSTDGTAALLEEMAASTPNF